MKKISIYTLNAEEAGSPYYAITQFIRCIPNIDVVYQDKLPRSIFRIYLDKCPKNPLGRIIFRLAYYSTIWIRTTYMILWDLLIRKPDVIIICREIFPKFFPSYAAYFYNQLITTKKVIWVFDDHIFESREISEKEKKILCRHADKIIITSEFLKDTLPTECHSKISYIHPTDGDIPLDMSVKQRDIRKDLYDKEIRIVWIGTATNLKYLRELISTLDNCAKCLEKQYYKKCRLIIVCNEKLDSKTDYLEIENIQWSRNVAVEKMALSHIGIMPLKETEYTRGKCGCKLVQYLTAGLPSVASSVGYNERIIQGECGFLIDDENELEDWKLAIIKLSTNWSFWERCSNNAFHLSQELFAFEEDLNIWKKNLLEENK